MKSIFLILLFLFMTSVSSISLASDAQDMDENAYRSDDSMVKVTLYEMDVAINAEHMKPSVDIDPVITKRSQNEVDFSWWSNYIEITMLPGEMLIDSSSVQHPLSCFGERSVSVEYMVAALNEASIYDESNQRNDLVIWHYSIGSTLFC